MNLLKRLFGSKVSPFLAELGQGYVWVVSLNQSNVPDFRFEEASNEDIRERLDRDIEETEGNQPRQLFGYDKEGRHILPVFSSPEAALQWMKKKPYPLDGQMFAFTQMRMQTLVLFANLRHLPALTCVMLDPETPDERELTPFEIHQTLKQFGR